MSDCDPEFIAQELAHLRKVFETNGYPRPLTSCILKQTQQSEMTTEPEKKRILFLPYIKGISEKIEICFPLQVKPVFRSNYTLRQSLTKVKSTLPDDIKKGVIYEILCADCEAVYVGETGCSLMMRMKEHKYAVKSQDTRNGIAVHVWTNHYKVNWEAAKITGTELHLIKRKVMK